MSPWLKPIEFLKRLVDPRETEAPGGPRGGPWPIVLIGLTGKAEEALGFSGWKVERFPFTLGREATRQDDSRSPQCDLVLPDREPYQVSRIHCAILWIPTIEGFFVQDTDSRLGTIVNGLRIGRATSRSVAPLRRGDNELVVGPGNSPFKFSVRLPKAMP